MPSRSQARDLAPHLGVPGGGVLEEVNDPSDRAVGAAADEGNPFESAGFPDLPFSLLAPFSSLPL